MPQTPQRELVMSEEGRQDLSEVIHTIFRPGFFAAGTDRVVPAAAPQHDLQPLGFAVGVKDAVTLRRRLV